jgi:preprotein translocase subunit SecY
VLTFPQFIAQAIGLISPAWGSQLAEWVNAFLANTWAYSAFYFVLVFGFTYFYTSIMFNPAEISKNLQRSGGFIPGIRPGEQTENMFQRVLSRITFFGALTLGIVAVIPTAIQALISLVTGTGMAASSSLALSGTAILIVVAVALESMRQIDSQLSLRDYDRN